MNRSDKTLRLRVIVYRAPYFADEDVEIRVDDEHLRPNLAEKLGFRHDVRSLDQKDVEDGKSLRRQMNILAVAHELARVRVEREPAEADFHRRLQVLENPWRFLRTSMSGVRHPLSA